MCIYIDDHDYKGYFFSINIYELNLSYLSLLNLMFFHDDYQVKMKYVNLWHGVNLFVTDYIDK
jgi:hypothetical protein